MHIGLTSQTVHFRGRFNTQGSAGTPKAPLNSLAPIPGSYPSAIGVTVTVYDPGNTSLPLPTVATPATPSCSASTTGGTLAAGTYYYKVAARSQGGSTLCSASANATTTGSTGSITVTLAGVVNGAVGYDFYRSTTSGGTYAYIGSCVNQVFIDTGFSASGAVPAANTTANAYYIGNGIYGYDLPLNYATCSGKYACIFTADSSITTAESSIAYDEAQVGIGLDAILAAVSANKKQIDNGSIQVASVKGPVGSVTSSVSVTGDFSATMKTSLNASTMNLNLSQPLTTAVRALDTVPDSALVVGDALVSAIAGAAGKEAKSGTSYTVATPFTGTLIRTFVLDNATIPNSRS